MKSDLSPRPVVRVTLSPAFKQKLIVGLIGVSLGAQALARKLADSMEKR